jgi:hypothetical protein
MSDMTERVEYAAAPHVVALLLGGGAVFAVLAYAEATGPGRLLLGVAALLCFAEGLRCALVRPVLAADERSVEIALAARRVVVPWSQVEACDGERTKRRGVTASALRVDVGETVYYVPAYRLGASLGEVVRALEAVRPR